jgi:hypothetical protein
MKLLYVFPIIFCIAALTNASCINFCNFKYPEPVATILDPFYISTGLSISPMSGSNHLIGIFQTYNTTQSPNRYVDDDGNPNACLPDECGIAGRVHPYNRINDDHDMQLDFVDGVEALEITFELIDFRDWNPSKCKATRWILTAYNDANQVVDSKNITHIYPHPVKKFYNNYDACDPLGRVNLTVSSVNGDIVKVTSVFERKGCQNSPLGWQSGSSDPNIAVSMICWEYNPNTTQPPCDSAIDPSNPVPSAECNDKGYCQQGSVMPELTGCSCFSGWEGTFCETEYEDRAICADEVFPTKSLFNTTIQGSFDNNNVIIEILAPIEVHTDDTLLGNYATYTIAYFKNQDTCDYPEGNSTIWTKEFELSDCSETYVGVTDFNDLLACTGIDRKCYQLKKSHHRHGDPKPKIIDCDQHECTKPPCYQCFGAQVQVIRGYRRTSVAGTLSDWATAENCHFFDMCLPWIQEVDVSDDIRLSSINGIQNNMIITRVAYACFDDLGLGGCWKNGPGDYWLVEITTETNYPWFIKEKNIGGALENSFYQYPLKELVNLTNCDTLGSSCIQRLTYKVKKCETLLVLQTYDLIGLEYDCSSTANCTAARAALNATILDVVGEVDLVGGGCEAEIVLDDVQTVSMVMDTYLDATYTVENNFFLPVGLPIVYFKIEAISNLDIYGLTIVQLIRQHDAVTNILTTPADYTIINCPAPTDPSELCFYLSIADLSAAVLAGDINIPYPVSFTATVEIDFTSGKRQIVRLGIESVQRAETSIRIPATATTSSESTTQESSVSQLVPSLVLVIFLISLIFQ